MKKTISQAVCVMGAMCVLISTPVASAQQGEYLAAANQAKTTPQQQRLMSAPGPAVPGR